MKKHIEQILWTIEGDYAQAKEKCDEKRMDELRAGLMVARRYFSSGIGFCRELIRVR